MQKRRIISEIVRTGFHGIVAINKKVYKVDSEKQSSRKSEFNKILTMYVYMYVCIRDLNLFKEYIKLIQ